MMTTPQTEVTVPESAQSSTEGSHISQENWKLERQQLKKRQSWLGGPEIEGTLVIRWIRKGREPVWSPSYGKGVKESWSRLEGGNAWQVKYTRREKDPSWQIQKVIAIYEEERNE